MEAFLYGLLFIGGFALFAIVGVIIVRKLIEGVNEQAYEACLHVLKLATAIK